MKTLFLGALAALTLSSLAVPAMAHEAECYSDARYFVIAHENPDYAGTQFIIRAKKTPEQKFVCNFEETKSGYLLNEQGDPLWYEGLSGQYLVTTRSTGPQGDLVIFDLDTRAAVLDKPAEDVAVDDAGVTYWERREPGTADNCPSFAENEANYLGSAIVYEARFDFATAKVSESGQSRCIATQ